MFQIVKRVPRTPAVATMLVLGAAGLGAQEVKDSTVADPDAHQVAFENEHVRVLRVLAEAGYRSAMHSHPPLLVVSLGTGRVKMTLADGSKRIVDLSPGQSFWIDSTQHAWELLAGEVDVVAVEVKAAKGAKAAAANPEARADEAGRE
jgi:quercetin dioxygenase-like cupin family protein